MIRSVLIANRGEIAVRIARTCREMGIRTIGVFSEADRESVHAQTVDEAYGVGPSPAAESYLRQDRILEIAAKAHTEAIHPGYGFLAENSEFAQKVVDAGLIWIGPPAAAIEAMGSKANARAIMRRAGIPVVPGSGGILRSVEDAASYCEQVGFPVLLKAVAGGGGKGMRVVAFREELEASFAAAQREAKSSFGDDSLYAERYIARPRHIEIQILADQFGNVVHLGERECSLQRRHQKIIEESPSLVVTPELRRKMGATAVAAAKACGYVNAGTVEMLLDPDGNFYFLEMNTRLQVEHAVTEEVTGLDLVRLQLMIASGETLPLTQRQVISRGHAIEVRVYAEDVARGFLPSTGRIKRLRPAVGPGIREDSGLREGSEITRFYDPMISKLIVRADNREAARRRMIRALKDYEIAGVWTNLSFCRFILESEAFARGDYHTRSADTEFLEGYLSEMQQPVPEETMLAAALAKLMIMEQGPSLRAAEPIQQESSWTRQGRSKTLHREPDRRASWRTK